MGCGPRESNRGRRAVLAMMAWCLVMFCGARANSQCVAITPTGSGSGNGSSWSNARAGIPASLTPGTTYYLADGSYPAYAMTSGGSAGSVITIRKATAADYGQNCSSSIGAGWNVTTMGSSQAVFPGPFEIQNSYFTLDGASRNFDWTGGGIKIIIPSTSCGFLTKGIFLDTFNSGSVVSNVTIQYVEVAGAGYSLSTDTCTQTGIYAFPDAPNFTLQYSNLHDATGGPIVMGGTNTVLMQYNLFARNQSSPTNHSEAISDSGSLNVTVRYNKFLDIVGTGAIVELNPATTTNSSNWTIYGNQFYWTPGNPNGRTDGFGNGLVSCQDTRLCTGWLIYNNTVAGCNWVNFNSCGIDFAEAGLNSDVTSENNIWFNTVAVNMTAASGITNTHDYNTYINASSFAAEPHGGTGSTDPFVNTAIFDLHLIQDMSSASTAGTEWAQGVPLAPPYNVDPDGQTRGSDGTWDRGAYENAGTSALQPPSNLQVSVF